MTDCITDTLVKPTTWLLPQETTREGSDRWQLNLTMPFEDSSVLWQGILAPIRTGGLFSVRTRLAIVLETRTTPGVTTDVEGELALDQALFDVHMIDPEGSTPPLNCALDAVESGKVYEGKWTVPCRNPQTCGCAGMSGEVSMVKLEDQRPEQ